jgi:signal peptidase I
MKETGEDQKKTSIFEKFKNSDNKVVSILREFLWVIIVVGAIAALLFAVSGTWPAVVTIESESMVPHMNVGDLVFVVQADRFGQLQTWTEGKETGYTKFGDYGDVIIYNPNGGTSSWVPFIAGGAHPIIHRAMYNQSTGPLVVFYNPQGGKFSPAEYEKIIVKNSDEFNKFIKNSSLDRNKGYQVTIQNLSIHSGYITKGDNNPVSDEGSSLSHYVNLGPIEPVEPEWIVGKALFTVPLVGYLPLNIIPVAIIIILVIVLHELYLRRQENSKNQGKKGKKPKQKK